MVSSNDLSFEDDLSIKYGKFLANAPLGEEVSISGISGIFPQSSNVEEFKNNLYNKVNLFSPLEQQDRSLKLATGRIRSDDFSKFDSGFFGVHRRQALTMSQICKLLLERCVECIFDAGLHPSDLEGTNTGVFTGISFNESEGHWYFQKLVENGCAILGNLKSMMANRISYFLKLNGPSVNLDTACSSTLYALDVAYTAIRKGEVEQAIVCGCNAVLSTQFTMQFVRLGAVSKEGLIRAFDEDGAGYVRAEAISAILLQKEKNCNRLYARVVHIKSNCDGFKEEGITYPSGETQLSLLKQVYQESGVNPMDISFVEAHGTGTPVGDTVELNCIDEFFAKGRPTPLLIGSVKSNMGHAEPAAALCSIVKAILSFENNAIPPNLHFKTPRPTVSGLLEERLEVVVERMPFRDQNGLIGLSSFGFGGANSHVILKWNTKQKTGSGKPMDSFPRLICASGRTEDAVKCLLSDIAEKFDYGHIGLIHNIFRKSIRNHLFRGYTIVSRQGKLKQSVKPFNPRYNKLHIYFGGMSTVASNLPQELLRLPILSNFKNRVEYFLGKKQLTLDTILSATASSCLNQALNDILTQLLLIELVQLFEIEALGVSCFSNGELSLAYFKNYLSLEEVLECVYRVRNMASDNKMENGISISDPSFTKNGSKMLKKFPEILNMSNGFHDDSEIRTALPECLLNMISQDAADGSDSILKNSIILVIGHSPISFGEKRYNVVSFDSNGGLLGVLETFGSLYENGVQPQIQKLYPKVRFPVSRGTPMISSKIQWKHNYEHFVPNLEYKKANAEVKTFKISLTMDNWADLDGHIIDGRNLFPATGYLYLVWSVISEVRGMDVSRTKVIFENCKFRRACTIPNISTSSTLELNVMIQRASGKFEICEGEEPVVTGKVTAVEDIQNVSINFETDKSSSNNDVLSNRDVYKELRLRGYNYKGLFKSVIQYNKNDSSAKIRWSNNWIAFMDNLLQIKVLGEDSRLLYVPISIARLSINPQVHLDTVEWLKSNLVVRDTDEVEFPVKCSSVTGIIRSGGVEVRGLLASSIPRKNCAGIPVLEKYQFVANETKLTLEQSVRVFMQVALENNCGFKINVGEFIDDASNCSLKPLGPVIQDVLADQPLVHSDVKIFSTENFMLTVKPDKTHKTYLDLTVVVGSELLTRIEVLNEIIKTTADSAYILSREALDTNIVAPSNLTVFNIAKTDQEKIVFFKKRSNNSARKRRVYVNVNNHNKMFPWLDNLKNAINEDCDAIAWCQNEPLNGILGLANCIRKEPGCQDVRALFIIDQAPDFEPNHSFYKTQLDKNMAINVYVNGQWGTYRHLLLDNDQKVVNEHCYATNTIRGNLSSIQWIEGPLTQNSLLKDDEVLIDVHYSSLNFRDVMTASGKINVDIITRDRRNQECVQGLEFSGKTKCGKRVMGIVAQGALATLVKADKFFLWEIPSDWSLQDAATIPVVYGTCLYGLVEIGKMKATDSVLIHSGTGGIGQAAINLCLNMGCTVFITVGTKEKKEFILKHFPKISENYIGNSRDLSFEKMIKKETKGRGVDIVLNSLADEKLFASVRCLAPEGRFLEIGKFDLANDNLMNMLPFKKGASYHGVMLDKLFNENANVRQNLRDLLQEYIDLGAIKPLMYNVFPRDEIEKAFRFMTAGKHMGKVLIEIRTENEISEHYKLEVKGLPRYYCNPGKSYIICGGLGGFGLELADWLVLRGAKNLILTSRKGIITGYQQYRISIWQSYGCSIKISTQDISSRIGCIEIIKEANDLAPVDAIFNLAVILKDAILENQTAESFETSFRPKAYATESLDEVSRQMCTDLRHFVVFSSVSCGRGNAGQSNYGMSNSIMERICEKRKQEGYPALAVQWGAIGDVGIVAELQENHLELEIGGTLQQSISNCIEVLDVLLRQTETSVVSSMVVAEKRLSSISGNIDEVIGAILGIKDIKTVSMNLTLPELGMDSINAVEVRQTLEREYSIYLSPSALRRVTFCRIKELQREDATQEATMTVAQLQDDNINLSNILRDYIKISEIGSPISRLRTKETNNRNLPTVIFFPGIEGYCDLLQNLTENLEVMAYGINYCTFVESDNVPYMAEILLQSLKEILSPEKSFHLVAHSLGSILALETVSNLEKLGYHGDVTLLDGSPLFVKKLLGNTVICEGGQGSFEFENALMSFSLKSYLDTTEVTDIINDILKCSTLTEKVKLWANKINPGQVFSEEKLVNTVATFAKRVKGCLTYSPTFKKLKSKLRLFKPAILSIIMDFEDYDLGQYCEKPVEIKIFEGTHSSILKNKELAETVMENLLDNQETQNI